MMEKVIGILKMKPVYIGIGLLVLLIVVWGAFTGIQNVRRDRKTDKLKANVNQALTEAVNVKQQISNLEQKQIEANANVNATVKEYQQEVFGHEQDKVVTNQALANFNKAMTANSNVSATAEDVLKALDKLDQ